MSVENGGISRREFAGLAGRAAAGCWMAGAIASADAQERVAGELIFDGKTLDGWIDIENNASSLAVDGVRDGAGLASRLVSGTDAVSVMLRAKLEPLVKVDLATYSAGNANAKALLAATVKDINVVIAGPLIYDEARFSGVTLRAETRAMLQKGVRGGDIAKANKLLIEDAYPAELSKAAAVGWLVKDGAIASTGAGRGVLYTAKDYGRYRLRFEFRHLSGSPDHYGSVLVFCARPQGDDAALDALGGVQFGLPNGHHWDYRPGMNNLGDAYFTAVNKTALDEHAWSSVEILVDATKGTARMAVAQPVGAKAVEVLAFSDAKAGRVGPIALQMHNGGLMDEYRAMTVEVDPKEDRLVTVV